MSGDRQRADVALVARGYFESRVRAREAIAAGLVKIDGVVLRKPSSPLTSSAEIVAEATHPYVSRGGVKLAAALDAFGIDPAGACCLDVGASTGGFTDVLLRRGARSVHAVDVGRDQLHPRLRSDPRVVSLERTDIRAIGDVLPGLRFGIVTVDVSFIAAATVIPVLSHLTSDDACLVVLVKPQFEAGRDALGKGGIVRDAAFHAASVDRVRAVAVDHGFRILGVVPSPITGGDGNSEFLLAAARG